MTEPQRHKLVAGSAVIVAGCLILYILFGFHRFDLKGLVLFIGFFAAAAKLSSIKHKHNPLI